MTCLSLLTPLLLTTLLVSGTVSSTGTVPSSSSPSILDALKIDFDRSHYDFDRCGLPTAGRARRSGGPGADDYNDGLDFDVGATAEATKGEMPWAVAVITKVPVETAPRVCTGTLISRRHVLSAAHCLATAIDIPLNYGGIRCKTTDHFDLNDFMDWTEVKYGGECLNGGGDSACGEDMIAKSAKIKKVTLFPFFREDCSRGSDLVILELNEDVDVPHACLSHLHDFEEKSGKSLKHFPFHTFAWPIDKSKGLKSAGRLQKSSLKLRQDRCTHAWLSLSSHVLCVADYKHISACAGESGAGLMTVSSSGRVFIIGVLSATSTCAPDAQKRAEARYTDIRLFSATIDRAIGTVGPAPDAIEKMMKPGNMTSTDGLTNLTSITQ